MFKKPKIPKQIYAITGIYGNVELLTEFSYFQANYLTFGLKGIYSNYEFCGARNR